MYSLIIPVYKNESSVPDLLSALSELNIKLQGMLEVIFVVDGSPDQSFHILKKRLPKKTFKSSLVLLSRNFGSFAAIRSGLAEARGSYFAITTADLQEPSTLIIKFFQILKSKQADVVIGVRKKRDDPLIQQISSNIFWSLYKTFVQKEMPRGGVDVFGCSKEFRDHLISLPEANSSLVGLLFWLGFRRKLIPYSRQKRIHGKSSWTFNKKLKYLMDSIFSFSDLPIKLLIILGLVGFIFFTLFALFVFFARIIGIINVPGYATTVLIISFFAGLNSSGLGIIGYYIWRAFENTKKRPQAIVMSRFNFNSKKK